MRRQSKFANLGEAAAFYGIGRAQFMEMRKMGVKHGDPLPVNEPAKMPAWFERMQSKGLRKRKCPSSVLARAAEMSGKRGGNEEASKKPATKAKNAESPVKTTPKRPVIKVKMTAEMSMDEMLTQEKQFCTGLSNTMLQMLKDGKLNTPEGQLILRERKESMERIVTWTKNLKHDRENADYMRTSEVKAAGTEFANGLVLLLRREFLEQFTPADHQKVMEVMDRVADRLPTVLPAALSN